MKEKTTETQIFVCILQFFSKLVFEEKNRQCGGWHMTEVFKERVALISAHRHLYLLQDRRSNWPDTA